MMMTEAEWNASTDPEMMLEFLDDASHRKLSLFGVACCRRTFHVLQDEKSRVAVAVAERFADGCANERELRDAAKAASLACGLGGYAGDDSWGRNSFAAGLELPAKAAAWAVTWGYVSTQLCNAAATAAVPTWDEREGEFKTQASLLRCIFGPLPFRSLIINPAWLAWNKGAIPPLAEAIYTDRAFDRLPILADALEDAGCTDPDILAHCPPGPHVRGCWVVDLLLGRS